MFFGANKKEGSYVYSVLYNEYFLPNELENDENFLINDLMPTLMARSAGHALALKNMAAVRVAINRSHGGLKTPVAAGDEIAFFPPVTGG